MQAVALLQVDILVSTYSLLRSFVTALTLLVRYCKRALQIRSSKHSKGNFTEYLKLCTFVALTCDIVRCNTHCNQCRDESFLIEFNVSRLEELKRSVFVQYSSHIVSILFHYIVHIVSLLLGNFVHFRQYSSHIVSILFEYIVHIVSLLLGEICPLSSLFYKYCFNI